MLFKARLFLPVLIVLVLFTGCRTEEEKIADHMEKSRQYISSSELKKAEIELKNVLQLNPEKTEAWLLLGEILTKLGNPKNAFQAYAKVEKLAPDNEEGLIKLAGFYLLGKKIDEAKERVQKLLDIDPENLQALFLKARILAHEKAFDNAAIVFNKILSLNPDHIKALQGLARIKSFQREFHQAEKLLVQAVDIDDKAIQPRLALVSYYISRQEVQNAEDQLVMACEKNPDNADLQIILGNFYFRTRKPELAEKAYLKAVETAPDEVKPAMTAAGFYDTIDKNDRALEMYEKALALKPDNLSIKNTLARFQYKNRNTDKAEALVEEILEKRPDFYAARMLKSELLVFKKEFDAALKLLSNLEKKEPKAPRLHYFKGLCQIGLGHNDRAMAAVTKAVELKPEYVKARLLLADIHFHQRAFDLAQTEAEAVLNLNPNNYRATMIHANSLLNTGNVTAAEKGFLSLIEIAPENPAGYYRMGLVKFLQKQHDAADDYLNQALAKNNMLMDVFVLLVRNTAAQNDLEKAHNLCQRQLKLASDNPSIQAFVHNLQGKLYLGQQKNQEAKASYTKAIQTNPDFLKSYMALARIHLAENNKAEAVAQYQALLAKKADLAVPHMMIGTIFDADQEYDKAADHYRKALEINPDFAPAANNLAYHLAERTDQYDKALALARTAKKRLPEDPGVMDTMGLVYYKKELYGNAVSEFLDALEKIPDNPVVHFHLGQAYNKKGETRLAKKSLKKALDLQKEFPGAQEAKALLETL